MGYTPGKSNLTGKLDPTDPYLVIMDDPTGKVADAHTWRFDTRTGNISGKGGLAAPGTDNSVLLKPGDKGYQDRIDRYNKYNPEGEVLNIIRSDHANPYRFIPPNPNVPRQYYDNPYSPYKHLSFHNPSTGQQWTAPDVGWRAPNDWATGPRPNDWTPQGMMMDSTSSPEQHNIIPSPIPVPQYQSNREEDISGYSTSFVNPWEMGLQQNTNVDQGLGSLVDKLRSYNSPVQQAPSLPMQPTPSLPMQTASSLPMQSFNLDLKGVI